LAMMLIQWVSLRFRKEEAKTVARRTLAFLVVPFVFTVILVSP
jgi:hypothetical protein